MKENVLYRNTIVQLLTCASDLLEPREPLFPQLTEFVTNAF